MNQSLVNTFIDYDQRYFDSFSKRFVPKEGSFDFIKRQSLPQDFIDFAIESSNGLDLALIKNIECKDQKSKNTFHLRVIQLLMAFGLSFCENDFLDSNLFKTPQEILEEDLYFNLKTLSDNESEDTKYYFTVNFDETKKLIEKTLKSVIFIFNHDTLPATKVIDNGYLSKAPIIIVYSKTESIFLRPNSFKYLSVSLIPRSLSKKYKPREAKFSGHKFFTLCEYRLKDDHWIPKVKSEDIYQICAEISRIGNQDSEVPIREDLLSIDFPSYLKTKLIALGLIGQCTDVFRRMGYKKTNKKTNRTFYPRNPYHPELVLNITDKQTDNPDGNKSRIAFLFLITPLASITNKSPNSPMVSTYEEATSDAYMWMKSLCSQVIILGNNKLDASFLNKSENTGNMAKK